MVFIPQNPFFRASAFCRIKMYKFRLRFHRTLFPRVQLTIFQHWLRWWLCAGRATSHCLNQWWVIYWRIYMRHSASIVWYTLIKSLFTAEFRFDDWCRYAPKQWINLLAFSIPSSSSFLIDYFGTSDTYIERDATRKSGFHAVAAESEYICCKHLPQSLIT